MDFPSDVPRLTDGVVMLRAHTPADIPGVLEQCTDPVSRHWTTVPVPYTLAHARSFVSERIPAGWRDGTARGSRSRRRTPRGCTGSPAPSSCAPRALALPRSRSACIPGPAVRESRSVPATYFSTGDFRAATQRSPLAGECRQLGLPPGRLVTGVHLPRRDPRLAAAARHAVGRMGCLPAGRRATRPRTAWDPIPVIRGERITLRPWCEADAGRVTEACSDEVTQHWLWMLPSPYTRDTALWYIRRHTAEADTSSGLFWCIADTDTDECLGNVSLMLKDSLDPTMREVGYWLHPGAAGRGIMTEAVALAVRHAFIPLGDGGYGLRRLTLLASAGNAASQRVAIRAGFTHVGTTRRSEPMRDGGYDDLRHYDLLAEEWHAGPTH